MRNPSHKRSILPFFLLFLVVLTIGWAGYYILSQPLPNMYETGVPTDSEGSEEPQVPEDPTQHEIEPQPDPAEKEPVVILETVQKGDTAGKILEPYLSPAQIQAMSDACEKCFSLRRLRVGKPYELTVTDGEFSSFVYEIDADKKLIVTYENGVFSSSLEDIVYEVTTQHVQGTITSHLFQAVSDAGEGPMLAISLADIFAWEINFIRDIHPGDSFNMLVEKRFREGEFKGYGRILAASFTNQGAAFEAFSFRDAEGFPHYYNSKGESVKRAFLKAPLSFTRISSTFSPKRLHPILKVWRAHPGVDYAAPTGTPVKAVGNATVTFKGWGKGAGNYIALRHNNGYETMYLHLSGFAKGLQKGKKVAQGEVIGFVGSTGYSTGPHLDFRIKKDGTYVNPLTIASPRTEPVSKKDMPEFEALTQSLREKLQAASAGAGEAAQTAAAGTEELEAVKEVTPETVPAAAGQG